MNGLRSVHEGAWRGARTSPKVVEGLDEIARLGQEQELACSGTASPEVDWRDRRPAYEIDRHGVPRFYSAGLNDD